MKFNKVKTSTTQLNNTLSKWIDKEVLEPMGDYADKFRDNCEYFIKTYEDEKKN